MRRCGSKLYEKGLVFRNCIINVSKGLVSDNVRLVVRSVGGPRAIAVIREYRLEVPLVVDSIGIQDTLREGEDFVIWRSLDDMTALVALASNTSQPSGHRVPSRIFLDS